MKDTIDGFSGAIIVDDPWNPITYNKLSKEEQERLLSNLKIGKAELIILTKLHKEDKTNELV